MEDFEKELAMTHTSRVTHMADLNFDAEVDDIHFDIDADPEFGGQERGPRPKKLLLAALAGCTGMDVVSILSKMKMPFNEFWLDVEADAKDDDPKLYTAFRLKYCFSGKDLDRAKIDKAIGLSQEHSGSVSAMFRTFAKIDFDVVLNP
jgi:putative redox protein